MTFTPISQVGEFGLIARALSALGDAATAPALTQGIGDDAAVISLGDGRAQVVTTDLLIEGVHFDRTFAPLRALGWKAIAVNVSDVCAMNAEPRFATVSLGLPNNISVEGVEALYTGIAEACERYGLAVAGGDTAASARLVISVTVLGEAPAENVVGRGGGQGEGQYVSCDPRASCGLLQASYVRPRSRREGTRSSRPLAHPRYPTGIVCC